MSQYKKDMIASFFFLILGALVLISVPLTIQDPGVSVMGPRVFPYFIGACMVILSLALMLTTIVKHRKAAAPTAREPLPPRRRESRPCGTSCGRFCWPL